MGLIRFIKRKIEEWRANKRFTAQNCLNRQRELKSREEKRKIDQDQRDLEDAISEIENRIRFVITQSYKQNTVIFQVNDGQEEMFMKIKDHFISNGFNAFFQKMDNLPVEALVISWM